MNANSLIAGEWNDSLTGEFCWSSANTREAIPDVMTPSTWALWQIYYIETNPVRLPDRYPFCGNIGGRPYLNLSLVASLYRTIGKDVRREMHGDILGLAQTDLDIPLIPFPPLSALWLVLPGMIQARRYASRNPRTLPEFLAATPAECRRLRAQIAETRDPQALLTLWRAALQPAFAHACRLLRSVTMQFTDPYNKLRLDLARLAGEAEANTLLSNVAGPSAPLESLMPLVGLSQVAGGALSREAYLERYGHRGPRELELSAPGQEEDPEWLDRRLAEFARSPVEVEGLLARHRAEWETAWRRVAAAHPRQADALRRRLDQVAAAAQAREAVRSEVTRLTRVVRRYVLRAGELTDLGDGLFFLSLDEIAAALSGDLSAAAFIPARREIYRRYSALPPYPAVIIGRFDPFAWAADPYRRQDLFDARASSPSPAGSAITGLPGAAGRAEGRVRRIDCPEEGCLLQPGEVLVAVTTNVGWTPLFPRAAAIVTDIGAPLSHAAIVARELGIPAVVGCGNATARLKTGDRVRVDGGRGVVELIP